MDKGVTSRLYGNYRAKVVENRDEEMFGRVIVWIPDLMATIPDTQGIWARPANNPIGGRNDQYESDHHYMGTCLIPKKGSWLFVFFECGNINRPYYFGALDLENTKVLPENQVGTNFQDKWTLFKSHEGRAIVVSDDESDARTEITGKKRQISNPPTGDTDSVYTIDDNQTTILFDERQNKEKILIRTYKGDFFHIDIDEQKLQVYFKNGIDIKTDGKFRVTAADNIDFLSTGGDIAIQSESGKINEKSGDNFNMESGGEMNSKATSNYNYQSSADINGLAGGNMNHDGASLIEQSGAASPASGASDAEEANPKGERDT
jgi:hypothetical protein